jgi:LAS superfamily LD-carboxypeptidase LdcB
VASLRALDPQLYPVAAQFVTLLESAGVTVTVTSTRRSIDEQTRLYNAYIAGKSKYPAAPPGESTHGGGWAFDLHLDPPVYAQAGAIWERMGFTWGGRFKDEIHFDARPRG